MTRLDRRKLLTQGAAAAVLATAGLPAVALPKSGGLLRAALPGAAGAMSWDSRRQSGLFMMAAGHGAVFDTLTEVAPDGSLRGELAESWEAEGGADRWRLRLRRGVTFHDGQPFTARDVTASLALHRAGSPAAGIVAQIARIRTLGPHDLRIELTAPDPGFPYKLSDYHLVIYPSGNLDTAMRDGIGTGLYRVEHFAPGERLQARRVEGHYRDRSAGFFDEIAFTALDDSAARAAALTDRHADATDAEITPRDGFTLRAVPGQRHEGLPPETGAPPFRASLIATHQRLAVPQVVGNLWPMDNARLAERWWMA
ncbi:peptide ABC transporter substrate-binding protein [Aquicoccus sp. SCR17]|nr:peptide ABC transporter substrate-binding protein [Carideicomes alvinocaridis]